MGRIPMFSSLDERARAAVRSTATLVRMARGAVIALEGQDAPPVFFVMDGLVVGYRTGLDGRAQTLARLHPGDPFYLPCVLGTDSRAPVSTRALPPSTLMQVAQADYRNLVLEHPTLALATLTELSEKMTHFVRLAGDLGVLGVRARLSRLLLELADGCEPPAYHGTQEDLAAGVGSVREVVSRHLHELVQMGLVQVSRSKVEIADVAGLRREAGR